MTNRPTTMIVPIMSRLQAALVVVAAIFALSASRTEAFATTSPFSARLGLGQRGASVGFRAPSHTRSHSWTLSYQKEEPPGLEGASNRKLYAPKFLAGIAFRVMGVGRKTDEEATHGVFQPPQDSMRDTVVVITGASSGLGLESAKRLALAGATVIATARTPAKTCAAVEAIRNYCRGYSGTDHDGQGPYANHDHIVRGIPLDLADLSSVRAFPDRYKDAMFSRSKVTDVHPHRGKYLPYEISLPKIHVVLNNASGRKMISRQQEREMTVDGLESVFQTSHLGHFVLTATLFQEGLLNDDRNAKGGCTVVNVSSVAHRAAEIYTGNLQYPTYGFDFHNIHSDKDFSINTYARSKLANIMFTKELQKRAANSADNSWLKAFSVEPGVVSTDRWQTSPSPPPQHPSDTNWKEKLHSHGMAHFLTTTERGANAQVWLAYAAATSESHAFQKRNRKICLVGGQHYDERRKPIPTSKFANDAESNRKLWELSEELGGIVFDLNQNQNQNDV